MLNPGYSLPSKEPFQHHFYQFFIIKYTKKVQLDIEVNAQYSALTTDAWTSLKNESYMATTIHFIDQNCELKSFLLS